jgi:hypothetical protein
MNHTLRVVPLLGLIVAACAIAPQQPHAGMSSAQVEAMMGSPTWEARLPGDRTRRFYLDTVTMVSRWRADFDSSGHMLDFAPATTSIEFAEVVPGSWKKSDVLERFGPPDKTEAAADNAQSALVYRYQENGVRLAYMYITLNAEGTVVRTEAVPVYQRPSHR